jgi:predicted transcriptional regulator
MEPFARLSDGGYAKARSQLAKKMGLGRKPGK